jgi:CHAT domain-containing protein
MKLLAIWHEKGLGKVAAMDSAAEAFRLTDAFVGHSVESAIVASSARVAAFDPELSALIRKEQDASLQIEVFQQSLAENISTSEDQQLVGVVADLKHKIATLIAARNALQKTIKERFPKYFDLTAPAPVTILEVQRCLRPSEALVYIYPASDATYVWAVSQKGTYAFSQAKFGRKELQAMIEKLRRALDPGPATFGDIPEFDLALAHFLYAQLLKPVADGWKGAEDLLIVAPWPLGQLPFSVLPTAFTATKKKEALLFSQYQDVPWLIRNVSIARLPSAATFVTLRKLPTATPQQRPFAGFGDPIFNPSPVDSGNQAQPFASQSFETRGTRLCFRGIRFTDAGHLDSAKITSLHLENLQRLPDTAEELENIARILNADPQQNLFLREKASERHVKTMDLSDRRVLAFATHALLPGDLDGLDQPAIALCSPAVTGENEDGLLTMGEIMTLKVNSDWVVLSACNTGAAKGKGAEAVSGLGRAFFYAGARAILVSMWPVETTSAKKLTTRLFHYQKKDKTLSRARALQKSMLALIDDPGLKDEVSGKIIASYAHPLFWASFIIVGEAGGTQN